jgi:hypothetical protein
VHPSLSGPAVAVSAIPLRYSRRSKLSSHVLHVVTGRPMATVKLEANSVKAAAAADGSGAAQNCALRGPLTGVPIPPPTSVK